MDTTDTVFGCCQNETQERTVASQAYDIIQERRRANQKGDDSDAEERKAEWVSRAGSSITKGFNERRMAVQQAMKNAFRKFVSGKPTAEEQVLPSAELIKKCVMRQIDVKNTEEWVLFKWYCDELIGKSLC